MELTQRQSEFLCSIGESLGESIDVGAGGVTRSLLCRLDEALADRELVMVKVPYGSADRRNEILDKIAPLSGSVLVKRARHAALLYRPAVKPVIELPSRTPPD
jgi:RNA-binding protein YhbY